MSESPDRFRYPDWKAPAGDGEVLVWPEPTKLLAETEENGKRLRGALRVMVQGVPLAEVRRAMRGWVGVQDEKQPVVATGHQTELYHPGVWVKDALINSAAAKLGGQAFHFGVDTDEPKHLEVRWPGGREPITDDPALRTAEWCGLLAPPTPAHLGWLEGAARGAAKGWGFTPALWEFLAAMRRLSLESVNLASAITNAVHQLDWELGLRHHALLTSPLLGCEAYLLFVHHHLARAGEMARQYNAALGEYRREQKIRTPGRPMPDLKVSGDMCEVPFWLDRVGTGRRQRATVVRDQEVQGGWALRLEGGERFIFEESAEGWEAAKRLGRWLADRELRLSPRALTLTMFLRLFVADQFVHGIGGARYDQVLDRLIEREFGLEPPRFSVTTATLYFPDAVGRTRACLPCVKQEGHRLRHNLLGEEKGKLVAAIAEAPRGSLERAQRFAELHERLGAAAERDERMRAWESQLGETQKAAEEDEVLFDRELFFAIQPRERLEGMIGRYRGMFE